MNPPVNPSHFHHGQTLNNSSTCNNGSIMNNPDVLYSAFLPPVQCFQTPYQIWLLPINPSDGISQNPAMGNYQPASGSEGCFSNPNFGAPPNVTSMQVPAQPRYNQRPGVIPLPGSAERAHPTERCIDVAIPATLDQVPQNQFIQLPNGLRSIPAGVNVDRSHITEVSDKAPQLSRNETASPDVEFIGQYQRTDATLHLCWFSNKPKILDGVRCDVPNCICHGPLKNEKSSDDGTESKSPVTTSTGEASSSASPGSAATLPASESSSSTKGGLNGNNSTLFDGAGKRNSSERRALFPKLDKSATVQLERPAGSQDTGVSECSLSRAAALLRNKTSSFTLIHANVTQENPPDLHSPAPLLATNEPEQSNKSLKPKRKKQKRRNW